MRLAKMLLLGVIVLVAHGAFAQDNPPKAELSVGYNMVVFNPGQFAVSHKTLNGGGGSVMYNITNHVGLKMELSGYGSVTYIHQVPVFIGAIPTTATVSSSGNLFTYMFGPEVRLRHRRFEFFGEGLIGGAHSNLYTNFYQAAGIKNPPQDNNGFAFSTGIGVDIPINRAIAVRPVQVDYLYTHFGNQAGLGSANQSNFRYAAAVVFRFGAR